MATRAAPINFLSAGRELLVELARRFPNLTSAELSQAMQDATAAAERKATRRH